MQLNDAQMLVLSALADGPLHGYAVNTAIQRMTGSPLGRGSLSSALARLHAKGLIEQLAAEGRRRPLQLTAAGRQTLESEVVSLAQVAGRLFEVVTPSRTSYLDRVAATGAGRSYKQTAFEALGVESGQVVVDLGCGSGVDLARLAQAAGPDGAVIGIDSDREMVQLARERTAGLPHVEVLESDIRAIPLRSGSVDRIRTDRVLQHVDDVPLVLTQARRLLRSGGRLVMAEPDWDSLAIDHPDLEISRAYTRHITDKVVRNGVIGRQLPRLAVDAGFTISSVVPITTVFGDPQSADTILGLERNTTRAVAAGYLTARQATTWLDHLAHGTFFAAVTLYLITADHTP
jgi:ubiquinone/menaquinone biosynthesis C-methylase UbiE